MKIKVTTSCSGLTFSFSAGQIVDVDNKIGDDLIKCGFAEEIKSTRSSGDTTRKSVKTEPEEDNDADD